MKWVIILPDITRADVYHSNGRNRWTKQVEETIKTEKIITCRRKNRTEKMKRSWRNNKNRANYYN